MMGGERSKQFMEKMYITYDKNFDLILELILSAKLPEEQTELHVHIEPASKKESEK